jgi:hypothetical protein
MQCGVINYLHLFALICTYLHLDVRDFEEILASRDIHGISVQSRSIIIQKKTGLPVQFELTVNT